MSLLAVQNPPNPWASTDVEWIGPPPTAKLQIYVDQTREILARNDSPDLPFTWSVNPYRGCFHGCAYCYARPTHQYLGFGAGTDFDRKIVVKTNIAERLRAELSKPSWQGDAIAFSGNTDCYQPLEASLRLTRGCLEVCAEYKNPVYIITKSKLVRRDAALLGRLARETDARVAVSIPFADDDDARLLEPFASPPSKRFETLRVLRDAGVPTTVSLAPTIPGLNDAQIPEILERAREGSIPMLTDMMEYGATILTREHVMDGVAEMMTILQVEALFPDGTKLVTVMNPIRS
ncbi:MAG: urease subunit gamma [Myxococcales bacterium]|nr:urease subunit gamma [Myxococcales bacterium]